MDKKIQNRLLEVQGMRAFKSKDFFYRWFNASCQALGNKKPSELVKTQEGLQMVLDELCRIERGDFV